jgi:hypothetical protein
MRPGTFQRIGRLCKIGVQLEREGSSRVRAFQLDQGYIRGGVNIDADFNDGDEPQLGQIYAHPVVGMGGPLDTAGLVREMIGAAREMNKKPGRPETLDVAHELNELLLARSKLRGEEDSAIRTEITTRITELSQLVNKKEPSHVELVPAEPVRGYPPEGHFLAGDGGNNLRPVAPGEDRDGGPVQEGGEAKRTAEILDDARDAR